MKRAIKKFPGKALLLFFLLLAQKKETKKRAGKSKCSAAFAMAHSQVAELFVFQIQWG